MNKIGAFLLSQILGEPKKFLSSWGGGRIFFSNFEKRRNTPLGNVVRNKHTKFEQDRSTGSVLKIGGKKESGEEEEDRCSRP